MDDREMSPSAHKNSPSVTTGRIRDGSLCSTQYSTSRFTHSDRAASSESNSTNQDEPSRASVIDDHR